YEEIKAKISGMNIEDDLFPGCTIASSVQYPPSNYEPILQLKS
ncbi:4993_t:CDS:1, partial [Funneliformis mosseae]